MVWNRNRHSNRQIHISHVRLCESLVIYKNITCTRDPDDVSRGPCLLSVTNYKRLCASWSTRRKCKITKGLHKCWKMWTDWTRWQQKKWLQLNKRGIIWSQNKILLNVSLLLCGNKEWTSRAKKTSKGEQGIQRIVRWMADSTHTKIQW